MCKKHAISDFCSHYGDDRWSSLGTKYENNKNSLQLVGSKIHVITDFKNEALVVDVGASIQSFKSDGNKVYVGCFESFRVITGDGNLGEFSLTKKVVGGQKLDFGALREMEGNW